MRKVIVIGVCAILAVGLIPIISKSLPWVREKESYRSVFSKEAFQAKMQKDPPAWMIEQINRDLQDFKEVSLRSVNATFKTVCDRVGPAVFYHYRIVNRELYKYVPTGVHFSYTDIPLEKALKTLLLYAPVPDVDFILCPMDGLPEAYMAKDFFITEDARDQAPILAKAKLMDVKFVALIPDQFSLANSWVDDIHEIQTTKQRIPWQDKKVMAVWRGGLTDIGQPNRGQVVATYSSCPRFILSKLSLQFPAQIDAGIIWIDAGMVPILEKEKIIKEGLSMADHLKYKYLPILDGHMCTYPGYQWRLLSNSVCFKQESNQIQWFYSALQPYVHYVPIQNDMSDLVEKIQWAKEHDDEAKQITERAQAFASQNLLFEDNYFYLYLVLKKYASFEKIDGSYLKQEMKNDPHWKCIQYRKRLDLQKSFAKCTKWTFTDPKNQILIR